MKGKKQKHQSVMETETQISNAKSTANDAENNWNAHQNGQMFLSTMWNTCIVYVIKMKSIVNRHNFKFWDCFYVKKNTSLILIAVFMCSHKILSVRKLCCIHVVSFDKKYKNQFARQEN